MHVAAGGEEIELRVICRAGQPIDHPVVAYAWRDRLGQILFSDDTFVSDRSTPFHVAHGKSFVATFVFRLPYLSSGPYSIEAFLFDRTGPDFVPLARRRDCLIIHVQSRHIFQQGLLNIGMRAVRLSSVPPEDSSGKSAVGTEAAPSGELDNGPATLPKRAGSRATMGHLS